MSEFDLAKERKNQAKHHISLGRWVDLEIRATIVDDRVDYGEPRFRVYGQIDGLAYCLVFTIRDERISPDQPSTRSRKGK